jgi:hypothetical protein
LSLFVVVSQPVAEACHGYFEASNGSEINDLHFGSYQGSLIYEVADQWLNDTSYQLTADEPRVAVLVQNANGVVHLRSNSNSAGDGESNLPEQLERQEVYLGHSLYGGCSFFSGAIGEVLLYSRAVSGQELLEIETYLQKKWACCGK